MRWSPRSRSAGVGYRVSTTFRGRNAIAFQSSIQMEGRRGMNSSGIEGGMKLKGTESRLVEYG